MGVMRRQLGEATHSRKRVHVRRADARRAPPPCVAVPVYARAVRSVLSSVRALRPNPTSPTPLARRRFRHGPLRLGSGRLEAIRVEGDRLQQLTLSCVRVSRQEQDCWALALFCQSARCAPHLPQRALHRGQRLGGVHANDRRAPWRGLEGDLDSSRRPAAPPGGVRSRAGTRHSRSPGRGGGSHGTGRPGVRCASSVRLSGSCWRQRAVTQQRTILAGGLTRAKHLRRG